MRNIKEIIELVEKGKFDSLTVEEQIRYDEYEQGLVVDEETTEE